MCWYSDHVDIVAKYDRRIVLIHEEPVVVLTIKLCEFAEEFPGKAPKSPLIRPAARIYANSDRFAQFLRSTTLL